MDDFRVKLLIFFIAICAVFFLAIKMIYAVDLSSLSLEKIQTIQDEYYIMDITQENYLTTNGNYEQFDKYSCGAYTCWVDEYLAPPYTENDIGYVMFIDTGTELIINTTGKLKNLKDTILKNEKYNYYINEYIDTVIK